MAHAKKLQYRSAPNEKGEWFAVQYTHYAEGKNINLWHFSKGLERVYSFVSIPGKYDDNTFWHEKLCQELLADLMSPKPSIEVRRFIVNGQVFFNHRPGLEKQPTPKRPEPLTEEQAAWLRKREADWLEEQRMFREDPAPLILYGKHFSYYKEYAWKLFPDKPQRQNIEPGNLVMVVSDKGPMKVKVTRIEEAGDREQPSKWVIHKIRHRPRPEQEPEKVVEENTEEATE